MRLLVHFYYYAYSLTWRFSILIYSPIKSISILESMSTFWLFCLFRSHVMYLDAIGPIVLVWITWLNNHFSSTYFFLFAYLIIIIILWMHPMNSRLWFIIIFFVRFSVIIYFVVSDQAWFYTFRTNWQRKKMPLWWVLISNTK